MVVPPVRSGRWSASVGILIPVVVAAVLLAIPAPRGAPSDGPPPPPAERATAPLPAPTLSLAPGTWTMESGGSVGISAELANLPPACSVEGPGIVWSLPGMGPELAFLNGSSGPTVVARSFGGSSGFFTVQAELLGSLDCGLGTLPIDVSANSTVTVLHGISVASFGTGPNPGLPGSLTRVGWSLSGGLPPYQVEVRFGDGSSTNLSQSTAGNGSVLHAFPDGIFAPEVQATDALGTSYEGTVAAPEIIEEGLRVAVVASAVEAEVGRPLWLNASVVGGVGPYNLTWYVADTPVPGRPGAPGTAEVEPTGPGVLSTALAVSDAVGNQGLGERKFGVAAAPSLGAGPSTSMGEIGRPLLLPINLSGGVPPYEISWREGPAGLPSFLNLSGNGSRLLPVVPNSSAPFVAETPLPGRVEAGRPLDLGISIVGGVPPYSWNLEPSSAMANASALSGEVGSGTPVGWRGTPVGSGNLTFRALVLDAVGGTAVTNESVQVLPSLVVQWGVAGPPQGDPSVVPVDLLVDGGLAPYEVVVRLGTAPPTGTNLSGPGPVSIPAPDSGDGFERLAVAVFDSAGGTWNGSEYVEVAAGAAPPARPAPAPSVNPAGFAVSAVGGALALLAVGIVAGVLVGRRGRPAGRGASAPEGGRALEVVRRVLSEGEPYDAESLAMIAEEEGIAPGAVNDALGRWERAGRVRRERDGFGTEVYQWSPPNSPEGTRGSEPGVDG